MDVNAQQQAAAAMLLPLFIDVPHTKIIRDLGSFFIVFLGLISGKSRVFKTSPFSSQTYPEIFTLVGSFIIEFLVLTTPTIPERAKRLASSVISSGTKPS
jgi:hypothetical protein